MKVKSEKASAGKIFGLAAVLAAVFAVPLARADQSGDAVTISLSGSTAMRSFTTSAGLTFLNPGTSITLNSGPGGTPVTYTAPSGATTQVQLAQGNFTSPEDTDLSDGKGSYTALRVEWHEQGSVEGILELANDQIGTVQSIALTNRNGSSGNPTWVNRNNFGGAAATVVPPPPGLGTITQNGLSLTTSSYDTHANYDDSNAARPGLNLQGGQNRVQMAISDVTSRQGFSSTVISAFNRVPGDPGYGKGNPALALASGGSIQGLGAGGVRHQLNDETTVNMPTTAIDPATNKNYAVGVWNTAGVGNLDNKTVAITATLFVANPGTGLEHLNRSDAQWLQTTGRLSNGADFNVATRDVNSGTLNVAANNVGLDPSFAVGDNDDNSGNASNGGTARVRIGPDIRFSNKTAGGGQLRPTVQNSRMAIGHLSMSDAIGSTKNGASRPLRALDYRDDADDLANSSNAKISTGFADPSSGTFVRANAQSIVDGSYVIYQNETYVTVKRPDAVQYTQDLIKGDNDGNDVRDVRDNILNAVANFPASSIANPADALVANSFILPQFMQVRKDRDGLNQSVPNPSYDATLSGAFLGSATLTSKFNPDDPATVTTGTSSNYGDNLAGVSGLAPVGGAIPINDKNYLFGDFDQRTAGVVVSGKGVRDYSDLAIAQQAQAALKTSGLGLDWNENGGSNATSVSGLPAEMNGSFTKGDLIVLGDFNSDGIFDGRDLYRMARGTALADNTSSTTLSGSFADGIRNGVLRKNAALDWLQANATADQKAEASLDGGLEFVKEDVNRDGKASLSDAFIVDKFIGKDYRNLDDQLAATITVNGVVKPISLVDVELNDTGDITQADLDVMNAKLTAPLNYAWAGSVEKTGTGNIVLAAPSGTISVAAGATFKISAGGFSAGGALDPFTDSTTGEHLTIVNNGSFNILAGNKHVKSISGGGSTTVGDGVSPATLVSGSIQNSSLTIHKTATVPIEANSETSRVSSLVIDGTAGAWEGKLDLSNNSLIVQADNLTRQTVLSQVNDQVGASRNGSPAFRWASNGITSSAAVSSPGGLTGLAVVLNDNGNGGTLYTTFGGISVDANSVLVKYTYYGDADVNGEVDADDYFLIDRGFTAGLTGYRNGDFDYSGKVDADDYFLIDRAFLGQNGIALASSPLSALAVPEPGLLSLIGIGAIALLRRRRSQ